MALKSILGEPYKSTEQASKALRWAFIGLCLVIVLQTLGLFFLWWLGIQGDMSSSPVRGPNFDSALLLVVAVILFFRNSRIVAGLLALFSIIGFAVTWVLKATTTESFSPPSIAMILAITAVQLAAAVFKTHDWQLLSNTKIPRSKWVMGALVVTFVVTLAGLLIPPFHFLHHTKDAVTLSEKGDVIRYHDRLDKYSFEYPKSWQMEHPPFEYGGVVLNSGGINVSIERWSPWSIAPVALFDKDAFLKMAQDEASAYSASNQLAIDSVEMVGPTKVNEAKVEYSGSDGSRRYVYYLYDRAWSRQTSDAAWFFWRITAVVPKGDEGQDSEVKAMLSSFAVNQSD